MTNIQLQCKIGTLNHFVTLRDIYFWGTAVSESYVGAYWQILQTNLFWPCNSGLLPQGQNLISEDRSGKVDPCQSCVYDMLMVTDENLCQAEAEHFSPVELATSLPDRDFWLNLRLAVNKLTTWSEYLPDCGPAPTPDMSVDSVLGNQSCREKIHEP